MLAFFSGLWGRICGYAAFAAAAVLFYFYERHAGKMEGEAIVIGQTAKEVQHSAEVSQAEQAKVLQLPAGESQKELAQEFNS